MIRKTIWPTALLPLAICGAALGQDALGSGRALDANLRSGSGGFNNPASDFYADLALRNAIVTGNAPGGQHFRAEVGYSAVGDFLGDRPEDLVFSFARDTYFSGLAAHDVRGISGLQLQMNVSVAGQSTPGGLIITRPGAGVSADMLDPAADSRRVDPFAALQGSLRSTTAYMIRQTDRPNVVGQRNLGDGVIMPMAASSLVGVRPLPFENAALSGPMDIDRSSTTPSATDPMAMLREQQKLAAPQGALADTAASEHKPAHENPLLDPSMHALSEHQQILETLRAATTQLDLRINPDQPSATIEPETRPTDTLENIEPTDTPTDAFNDLDAALRRLTDSLALPKAGEEVVLPEDETALAFDPMDPESRRPAPPANEQADQPAQERGTLDPTLTMLVDALAQEEFTVRHFAPEQQTTKNDLYATHMRAGEQALLDGRWIDAEERFAVALTVRPGDAMAALGRVQAQIGAGLLRSAASNLRELMRAYPELAGAKLDATLMAPRPRLDKIAGRLELQRDRKGVNWIDAAFLSAYLARVLNDPVRLVQAFEDLERAQKTVGVTPDPVYSFLERVWVADTYDVMRRHEQQQNTQPTGEPGSSPR
ncbi:MAG: hypothetical protein KDA20_08155 [Phycisphaerales bacterium]|nr:hypothetical protein [Phycisphaerales bacterium]